MICGGGEDTVGGCVDGEGVDAGFMAVELDVGS